MNIIDLQNMCDEQEKLGLTRVIVKYNPGPKWKWRGQRSVRTTVGTGVIMNGSREEGWLVVAIEIKAVRRYIMHWRLENQ